MKNLSIDTKKGDTTRRRRGRPPAFDREKGVETALRLFHERGYDHVGTAELCAAFGVKPPSLYAAYGSKLGLFEAALDRYAAAPTATFVGKALDDATTPEDALHRILGAAAQNYAKDGERRGCLALEGSIAPGDVGARDRAQAMVERTRHAIVARLAELGADEPGAQADMILTLMRGLSASARAGADRKELERTALKLAEALSSARQRGSCHTRF